MEIDTIRIEPRQHRSRAQPRSRPIARGITAADKEAMFKIPFGDDFSESDKPDEVARIIFGNVGPGGLQVSDPNVVQGLRNFVRKHEANHLGVAESRTNWPKIPKEKQLSELFRSETSL